ncbi:MAG: hypothetical protein HYZ53_12780 [Planctomycetes bacterium]|nr:hypothetical protein [Planctomycetota bacterium]
MTRGKAGAWAFSGAVGLALWPYLVGEARRLPSAEKNAPQIRREMLRRPETWVPSRNLFETFAGGSADAADPEAGAAVEVEPEPEPESTAQVELSGIVLAGGRPLAILNGSAYGVGEPLRDARGAEIGRVLAIRTQQVLVTLGRREVELKLFGAPSAPARASRPPHPPRPPQKEPRR